MLKLRTLLLSNYPYYIILILVIILTIFRLQIPHQSKYDKNITKVTGIIINIKQNNNKITLTLKEKEKVLVTYYLKDNENCTYNLGDKVEATGTLKEPSINPAENLFNYKKYLEHKNIFYIMTSTTLTRISKNRSIYYFIKQKIILHLNNDPYLYTFIIGDKTKLEKEITTSYQKNGISHLFAISGMHITLLSSIFLKILKKLKITESKRYFITSLFLLFYLLLTGLSPSILRGVLFFILFSINKVYYFYIKPTNLYIISLSITLLINENYIYDIGFLYSYSISLALIIMAPHINAKNYFITILKISLVSFLVSLPISLYNFFEINLLSIIYNLIFVPLVSIIIFPLSIVTFICPFLLPIFSKTTKLLENLSLLLSKITILTFTFPRLNIFIYIAYIITVIITLKGIISNKKKNIFPLLLLLITHYLYPYFTKTTYIKMINVGQGDSILLHSNNENILIDTGGTFSYNKKESSSEIATGTIIPLLKSLGIRKLDHLLLSHGDDDHMGEAKTLLENFKVENIIINQGKTNQLEEEIIKNYPVTIGEEGLTINCGDIELIQLNETFEDENSSSQIYYGIYNDISMLFMGDASIESEQKLLKKYDLKDITILKVGHHGSKTSSSKKFINTINPSISLISVGLDNKFNHPSKGVIEILKENDSIIYQTSLDGTITINLNTLKIKTTN